MTAQILAADLGTLIQDSKRKSTELRNAAEKSLQDLKSLPLTSETQLSADLARRPHFITPFLTACNSRNARFIPTGVSGLQRLTIARALPKDRLPEVLHALKECLSSSHDVQLKILQALPSLIQNYPDEIRGDLLSTILHICSSLHNAKNGAVSNTAAAALQQLVISVFDRVASEDEQALEIPTITDVQGDDGSIPLRPAALDAYKVFNDLSLLVTGEKPVFIQFSPIPAAATLEVIEAILSNHSSVMTTHSEQIHLLRSLLMPTIIRSLSDRLSFPVTLRIIRVLSLILRRHIKIMPSECEIALGLLNHMLDPEAANQWKRVLCLEVFRGIYADPRLVLQIFSLYDMQNGKKNIFGDNLTSFVRLSTEKPTLIGLGQHSTLPSNRTRSKDVPPDHAVAEADALAGVIVGPAVDMNHSGQPAGISAQWSNLKTACIEHLDKSEPPNIPETYAFSLVLTCITNISESLAKFILPLTVHHDNKSKKKNKPEESTHSETVSGSASSNTQLSRTQSFRKKTIPINPLDLEGHPSYLYIKTSAALVVDCWPAILATCSTFLNAALDTDYYRALVRAIQKFTQVAGLLRLTTPRDAFLTTLGKAVVPSSMLLANVSSPRSPTGEHQGTQVNTNESSSSMDDMPSQNLPTKDRNHRSFREINLPTLGPRNLLCLRALLNLAIALGPTLNSAWSIAFETLQVADFVMAMSNQGTTRTLSSAGTHAEPDTSMAKVEAETSAVQAAARRLFESTVDFPNDSFVEVLQALCALVVDDNHTSKIDQPRTGRPQALHQRRLGSVSGISIGTDMYSRDSAFALNKIGELAALNEERLAHFDPSESGWSVLVAELIRYSTDDRRTTQTRLLSADILSRTVREIAGLSTSVENRDDTQARILSALHTQISALHQNHPASQESYSDTDVRVHQLALEALRNVIEQCGESLTAGWASVFHCLLSVFPQRSSSSHAEVRPILKNNQISDEYELVRVISRSLARTAFDTVQFVCSDFLAAVPNTSLASLLELLLRFSCQQDDLNMSLTAVTFFWNVSDFLHVRGDLAQLRDTLGDVQQLDDIRQVVLSKSREGDISALWTQVPLNLSIVTTDRRAELRNTAIQTIQRIFENYIDQLSSTSWMLCLRTVLFGMIESNLAAQCAIRSRSSSNGDLEAWNDTTTSILDSVTDLLSVYMEKFDDAALFGEAWSELLEHFRKYFLHGSHALGCAVFVAITKVLARLPDVRALGVTPLLKTTQVWSEYFDGRDSWRTGPDKNQDAFVAYAHTFKEMYRLAGQHLESKDVKLMLGNLEMCIVYSDEVPYSSDIDNMTQLQQLAIECFGNVRSDSPGLPEFLIRTLSRLVVLPYSAQTDLTKRGPTFVALSKASMGLLEATISKHVADDKVYSDDALACALTSLARPIEEKYAWQREGKPPALWQKATSTTLEILGHTLDTIDHMGTEESQRMWEQIVTIASGILGARINPSMTLASLQKDEDFDREAFSKLRDLITLPLGSPRIPDELRRRYTRHVFETSIIHEPVAGEIADVANSPLEDVYKIRLGRTDDRLPKPRVEMAYMCMSELFSLTSAQDGSASRVKLAQAAAPYLILRVALVLRAFIADHGLRGRMPQPESHRRELLFVLGEMGKLKSEPAAIPDVAGVRSKHRKHVHRIYPLVVKAMRVAGKDEQVFEALVGLTEIVGMEIC
ncbi:unnamed protein product [Periconia digitata]|uniref:Endosomal peripheral membrane protein n=1 Tax=Periconia digitata TaxID=1303443 RepID=A0A9W4U2G2_9PLEO|nr:unnamed protein product [Periconia digitata]